MEIYTVRSGDTLYKTAARFGVSADDLAYWNGLSSPDILSVGQALVIPGRERSHTVRRGETMFTIAKAYGVSLGRLIAANPEIRDPAHIMPGDKLVIPAEGCITREITVNGYATDISDAALGATLPYLTFLSPFAFRADEYGGLTPTFDVNLKLSSGFRTANLLTAANILPRGGFSGDIAHAILNDRNVQDTFIGNIETQLSLGGYYGVNLDFEYVYQFDRELYNRFVTRLADRLHYLGYVLVTALAPKYSDSQTGLLYTAHDYAHHGAAADYVVLMTYEWGYLYGPPMAVAPVNMVRRVLDYAVSVIPSGKILMGVPNYGYDWTLPYVQGTSARPLTNAGAVALAGSTRSAIYFDEDAKSPFFRYTDAEGRRHEVWFEDARSLKEKYALIDEYGLGGVSFWNINNLFRPNYIVLESMYGIEKVM